MIDKYNEILELYISKNNFSSTLLGSLCVLLLLVLIVISVRAKKKKRKNILCLTAFVFLMLITLNVAHFLEYSRIQKDIFSTSYREYVGNFSYGTLNEEDSIITIFDNEKDVKLRYDERYLLEVYDFTPFPELSGHAYGKVIYSSNSKIVVFVQILE